MTAYVTCHIGVGSWDQAVAVRRAAGREGWDGSTYVDSRQWVVRLTRSTVPTPQLLDRARRYVEELVRAHGGEPRGVSVEEPLRASSWELLAEQVVEAVDEALEADRPAGPDAASTATS